MAIDFFCGTSCRSWCLVQDERYNKCTTHFVYVQMCVLNTHVEDVRSGNQHYKQRENFLSLRYARARTERNVRKSCKFQPNTNIPTCKNPVAHPRFHFLYTLNRKSIENIPGSLLVADATEISKIYFYFHDPD